MKADGVELTMLRYVLRPLFKNNLPKHYKLHELYYNTMRPHLGEEQALLHLWYGVSAIGTVDPDCLLSFCKKDSTLTISNKEVLYRKVLVKVAIKLAEDVEKCKRFIETVIWSDKLDDCNSLENFMPPEHEHQNNNAFIPHILKLFEEADDQEIIKPTDLSELCGWLNTCNQRKLSRDVAEFKSDTPFTKTCKQYALGA